MSCHWVGIHIYWLRRSVNITIKYNVLQHDSVASFNEVIEIENNDDILIIKQCYLCTLCRNCVCLIKVGTWVAGMPGMFTFSRDKSLNSYIAKKIYKVVTVEVCIIFCATTKIQLRLSASNTWLCLQTAPFINKRKRPDGSVYFDGYCIDLLHEIQNIVMFEYEIYESPDGAFGAVSDTGEWNGMIKELIDKVHFMFH